MKVNPRAGKPTKASMPVNVPGPVTVYYTETPDSSVPEQRVTLGVSGHRGSAFEVLEEAQTTVNDVLAPAPLLEGGKGRA